MATLLPWWWYPSLCTQKLSVCGKLHSTSPYLSRWHRGPWCCQCEPRRSTFPCRRSWAPWGKSQRCRCRRCRRPWWSQTCRSSPAPEQQSEVLKEGSAGEESSIRLVYRARVCVCILMMTPRSESLQAQQPVWWTETHILHSTASSVNIYISDHFPQVFTLLSHLQMWRCG